MFPYRNRMIGERIVNASLRGWKEVRHQDGIYEGLDAYGDRRIIPAQDVYTPYAQKPSKALKKQWDEIRRRIIRLVK